MTRFPIYGRHSEALCAHCGTVLGPATAAGAAMGPAQESGYPPRYGEYVQQCPQCLRKTWYDLEGVTR